MKNPILVVSNRAEAERALRFLGELGFSLGPDDLDEAVASLIAWMTPKAELLVCLSGRGTDWSHHPGPRKGANWGYSTVLNSFAHLKAYIAQADKEPVS